LEAIGQVDRSSGKCWEGKVRSYIWGSAYFGRFGPERLRKWCVKRANGELHCERAIVRECCGYVFAEMATRIVAIFFKILYQEALAMYLELPYTTVPYTFFPYTAVPYTVVPYTAGSYTAVSYTVVPYTVVPYTAVSYTAVSYTAVPYTAGPYTAGPYTAGP